MLRSEAINELAAALAKAQGEMKAAPKSKENPHFKSKYAPLNEVIDVAKVLAKHGLSFVQPARMDESGAVVVETVLLHSSGQWLSESLALRPQQNTPQGVGSAITYGRRFGLSSLVGIAADEDDDGNAASTNGNGKAHAPAAQPNDDQQKRTAALRQRMLDADDAETREAVARDIHTARDKGLITAEQAASLRPEYMAKLQLQGDAPKKATA